MRIAAPLEPRRARLARWSLRLALFAVAILLITLLTHRFAGLPTPLAMNLIIASIALGALAILSALIAGIQIWVKARTGAWNAAIGFLLGVPLTVWPLAYLNTARTLPQLNDISTDLENVPRFVTLAQNRPEGANRAQHPGREAAKQQLEAYPDLRPILLDRSVEEAHDLVYEAMRSRRGLNWRIVHDEIPSAATRPPKPGLIEAVERTTIMGFTDEIVVRIVGDDRQSRIDIRSKSRFGRHDLGANAARVRRFVREMNARIEATQPAVMAARGARRPVDGPALQAAAKRPKERERGAEKSPDPKRTSPARAEPDAQRAPRPRAQPRE
jgi:uncharacterized protein (DUF1499 family)